MENVAAALGHRRKQFAAISPLAALIALLRRQIQTHQTGREVGISPSGAMDRTEYHFKKKTVKAQKNTSLYKANLLNVYLGLKFIAES